MRIPCPEQKGRSGSNQATLAEVAQQATGLRLQDKDQEDHRSRTEKVKGFFVTWRGRHSDQLSFWSRRVRYMCKGLAEKGESFDRVLPSQVQPRDPAQVICLVASLMPFTLCSCFRVPAFASTGPSLSI